MPTYGRARIWDGIEVKALTLSQPWASLISAGAKKIETRNWHPQVNPGVIAIASSKSALNHGQRYLLDREPFCSALVDVELPRGSILAIARIDKFARTENVTTLHDCDCPATNEPPDPCICMPMTSPAERDTPEGGTIGHPERAFGDYRPRRWAWYLEDIIALKEPILIPETPKGHKAIAGLGLWPVPPHLFTTELNEAVEAIEAKRA